MNNTIAIDLGYSSIKISYNGQFYKVPSMINFYNESGIQFGSIQKYEFEDGVYTVGEATSDDSFTTTDFKFLFKFAPLMIYHILKQLEITGNIKIKTGLALIDWGDTEKRDSFVNRISTLNVNGETINCDVELVGPQGNGCFRSYIHKNGLFDDKMPKNMSIIDIGYRTINFLNYENGVPNPTKSKSFPDHGVVSIIKPFTNMLENKYGINFSEQESIKIFLDKEFFYGGQDQPEIVQEIIDAKSRFVQKLMNSILVSEKKTLQLSRLVLISGGGAYMLKDMQLPPNVVFGEGVHEFENCAGYLL